MVNRTLVLAVSWHVASVLAVIILFAPGARSQTTTVTGTAVDSNGNAYFPGTISAYIILSTGQAPPPGVPASGSIGSFPTAAGGSFSISVPSPFLWQFTICGVPTNTGPRANPSPTQVCFSTTTIPISGGSQDITGVLPSPIPLLGPGGGVLASPITSPSPLSFDVNLAFKGPNPYVDATRFGVRAVNPSVAPAVPGVTASCTNGSPNVITNAASTFQNGDGVALYGCGPGTMGVPATPTVTPSLLSAQTGLLLDVNGPVGATQYCYQLLATLAGATNVSAETCTATGPASLGLQTNTITTETLSNTTATYVTSAPHGLVVGAHINVTGSAVTTIHGQAGSGDSFRNPFNGWFTVATVADNTHFTVNLLSDSRNGAVTAGTGGTVSYWNSIHIVATETTNNFQYYVYGRVSGGTKTLIGVMWPQNVNLQGRLTDPTYLAFDDLGSPVTTFPSPPSYVPTTVPTTPTNSMLSTTIVSGAGTTSLVLASNAGNTISGATILLDDAVTFLAAAAYASNNGAGTSGPLMLPWPGSNSLHYVFNSPISIGSGATAGVSILQKGNVWLNEPITTSNVDWHGQQSSGDAVTAFANQITPLITFNKASPGFYALYNTYFYDLEWAEHASNGSLMFVQDNGGIPAAGAFNNITFILGTATTYSNMAAVFRGGGAGYEFRGKTLFSSSQNGSLTATTPALFFDLIGNVKFDSLSLSGVGAAAFRMNPSGGFLIADEVYSQGSYMPYFSVVNSGAVMAMTVRNVIFDTTNVPLLANYGGSVLYLDLVNSTASPNGNSHVTGSFPPGGSPRTSIKMSGSTNTPINTGVTVTNVDANAADGTFGRGNTFIDIVNRGTAIGPAYSLFTTTGPPAAPTSCPVSAGGSVPVGLTYYWYAPVYPGGSEGTISLYCTATTTGGNQTVTVNWTAIAGVTQYNLYRGTSPFTGGLLNCSPSTGASYVDTVAAGCGGSIPVIGAGGPAGMRGGLVWGNTVQIGNTAFANLGTPPNGTLLFCSDCTIANPCAGGGTGALAKRLNGVWVCN